jgi:hypothetical protein
MNPIEQILVWIGCIIISWVVFLAIGKAVLGLIRMVV